MLLRRKPKGNCAKDIIIPYTPGRELVLNFRFRTNSKFALLAIEGVGAQFPDAEFQLSEGTWVMPRVPVPDLGVWKKWIGSIRTERLDRANLVLMSEEESDNPQILDAVHKKLEIA